MNGDLDGILWRSATEVTLRATCPLCGWSSTETLTIGPDGRSLNSMSWEHACSAPRRKWRWWEWCKSRAVRWFLR